MVMMMKERILLIKLQDIIIIKQLLILNQS